MNWMKMLEVLKRPVLPGGKPVIVAVVAAMLVLTSFVGYLFGKNRVPNTVERVVVREVTSREMQQELEGLRLKNEGLLARIRGMVEVGPEEILNQDEPVVGCPEQAITEVRIAPFRFATYGRMTMLDTDSATLQPTYQLSLLKNVDVSRCTEFYFNGEEFICDTPRLGVLDLFFYGHAVYDPAHAPSDQRFLDAGVGIRWQRWPASRWKIEAAYDVNGWFTLGLRREFRILGK